MKPIKHISLIAWGSLDDVAMIVPIIRALRDAKPDLAISVVIESQHEALLEGIDNITIVALRRVLSAWWTILRTGVDAVCDLSPGSKSFILTILTRLTAIRSSRLSTDGEHLRHLTRRTRKRFEPVAPVATRAVEAIARTGVEFELPASKRRKKRPLTKEIIRIAGKKSGSWIGVAPFARYKGKIYPIPQMVKLLEMLSKKYERLFIFGGSDVARLFAEGIEHRIDNVHSVIGKLTLKDELTLLSNLDVVVTMDSATMHLASIVGTPVVSVWGATHPYEGFYGYGLKPEWVVQQTYPCRPCSKYGRKPCIWKDYRCMTGIKPAEIMTTLEKVING